MTYRMLPLKLRAQLAGLLILLTFGSLVGACTYDEAKFYCFHGDSNEPGQGGFTGPGLEGCIVGAHEIGPRFHAVEAADIQCACRYPVSADLNSDHHCDSFTDRGTPVPFENNPDWMQQTHDMIERETGCHYGALGHLTYGNDLGQ